MRSCSAIDVPLVTAELTSFSLHSLIFYLVLLSFNFIVGEKGESTQLVCGKHLGASSYKYLTFQIAC